ncbi:hypothetical protein B0H63DRAFT_319387 [Podospora didyma]|uniref:Uncharacterized protein n=1 Tax=Podospora didyma TaxID=330526 RepID=A0AAE0K5Y4_9PEZI|nr:hypothetical protein B0H63DRAFT_319387 [Podospora didyma]
MTLGILLQQEGASANITVPIDDPSDSDNTTITATATTTSSSTTTVLTRLLRKLMRESHHDRAKQHRPPMHLAVGCYEKHFYFPHLRNERWEWDRRYDPCKHARGQIKCAKTLLEHSADIHCEDNYGFTAVDYFLALLHDNSDGSKIDINGVPDSLSWSSKLRGPILDFFERLRILVYDGTCLRVEGQRKSATGPEL